MLIHNIGSNPISPTFRIDCYTYYLPVRIIYNGRRYKAAKDIQWRERPQPNLRKVPRPPYETLLEDKESLTWSAMGRKYGVSDNAIRKWFKIYEKYGDSAAESTNQP